MSPQFENNDWIKNLLAGLFFVMGIIIICFFVFTISKDEGLNKKRFLVTVLFREVGGLGEGAPVRLLGVNVGNVYSIDFLDKGEVGNRRVKVVLGIFEKYRKQLDTEAVFAIETEGVLGEKLIEIRVVENGQKLDLSKPILGKNPFEVQALADVFLEAAQSFTKTSKSFGDIDVKELTDVMVESSRAMIETSNKLNDVINDLEEVGFKTKRLLDRVEQRVIDGTLFKVF